MERERLSEDSQLGMLGMILAFLLLVSISGCCALQVSYNHQEIMNGKRPAIVNVPKDGGGLQ